MSILYESSLQGRQKLYLVFPVLIQAFFVLQAKLLDIFFGFLIQLCVCFAGKYLCFDATGVADIPPACIVAEKS